MNEDPGNRILSISDKGKVYQTNGTTMRIAATSLLTDLVNGEENASAFYSWEMLEIFGCSVSKWTRLSLVISD